MRTFPLVDNAWLIRLDYGEEFTAALIAFSRAKKIHGAVFHGQGALKGPVLAYYDLKKKRYIERRFRGLYEAAGMTGNLAMFARVPAIHCHVVIGDKRFRAYAGHLVRSRVGGTLEIVLEKTRSLKRLRDGRTGLNLLA
ncbi:MAG: DNA-binding protein [bacterium]|nr:DNA-binding protein [bacterium]